MNFLTSYNDISSGEEDEIEQQEQEEQPQEDEDTETKEDEEDGYKLVDTIDSHEIKQDDKGNIIIKLNQDNTIDNIKVNQNHKKRALEPKLKIGVDKCEICATNTSKYKCPGCSILFCNLVCSNKHRVQKNCNGTMKRNHFIPLSEFSDSDISNDFSFLESINRVNKTGKALIKDSFVQYKSKLLQHMAFSKSINLYVMPQEMSRHKENTTTFHKRKNKPVILWRVEWMFMDDNFKCINTTVLETPSIYDTLVNHIDDPVNRYSLKKLIKNLNTLESKESGDGNDGNEESDRHKMAIQESLVILMKRERSMTKQYYRIDISQTIEKNLYGKELIEYPTFLVFMKDSLLLSDDAYTIITNDELLEIQNEQLSIIQKNLNSKKKFNPDSISNKIPINPEIQAKKKLKIDNTIKPPTFIIDPSIVVKNLGIENTNVPQQ
ncbi:hypothetical protein DLAC_10144 [Tieghemostelium lacteum]|uniref:HIT-type domain-containing protein n=1 Tax=Tieghemostelium lacteum TaxID=361077 RepID=A0A151Z694_TIELA|nr:hypothetical protein DLAC_10144 [Tieghemostelium lacteum]|eukprot:KYQ89472.1 hypothetical protein DLAC_10144 [Tieghemostelium lacteum]